MRGCARTQDGRPPPVSQTDFEAKELLVKMASAYLRLQQSLPSANVAAAPLIASDGGEASLPSVKMAAPSERR